MRQQLEGKRGGNLIGDICHANIEVWKVTFENISLNDLHQEFCNKISHRVIQRRQWEGPHSHQSSMQNVEIIQKITRNLKLTTFPIFSRPSHLMYRSFNSDQLSFYYLTPALRIIDDCHHTQWILTAFKEIQHGTIGIIGWKPVCSINTKTWYKIW